jgi:hypothetical protein
VRELLAMPFDLQCSVKSGPPMRRYVLAD